jgi:hypothetical protein
MPSCLDPVRTSSLEEKIELGTYMSSVGLGRRFEQRRRLATASTNED